jgi:hypothetical protein
VIRQAQIDKTTEQENRQKQFEPKTQRLDKVEKAVKQTDKDLPKRLEPLPKQKPKQLEDLPKK